MPHENVGRLIKILGWIALVALVAIFAAVAIPAISRPDAKASPLMMLPLLLFLAIPAFLIILGGAVARHQHWARAVAMMYGALLLFGFPLGTVAGAYILWNLGKHWDAAPPAQPPAP